MTDLPVERAFRDQYKPRVRARQQPGGSRLAIAATVCILLVIRDMDTGQSVVRSTRATGRAAAEKGLRLGTPLLLREETGSRASRTALVISED
jgi:hypothetical protein